MYAHDGRLHFHRPFLDRLTNHKPDAPCALAAFLLLNVIDELRHPEFDAEALNLRINAVYSPLGRAASQDPQVFYLIRIAERLRRITQSRDVRSITPDVIEYANWLATESRFDDALSVLDTGDQATAERGGPERANIHMRRGFTLARKGRLGAAADAYNKSIDIAGRHQNERTELLGKIGLAKVWRMQGRVVDASRELLAITEKACASRLNDIRAIAHHDIGADPFAAPATSLPFLTNAYHAYEETHLKKRALADIGHMLVKLGYFELATQCLAAVERGQGAAFRASVLGTRFWIAAQTSNKEAFIALYNEYEHIDHQLAVATEADIKLRIGQCFLFFANYVNANRFLREALELASTFIDSATTSAAQESLEIVKGNVSIGTIQIRRGTAPLEANPEVADGRRLVALLRELN